MGQGSRARRLAALVIATLGLVVAACASAASPPATTQARATATTATVAGPPTPTPYGAHPCSATTNPYIANLMTTKEIPSPTGAIISDQGARKTRLNEQTIIYEWVGDCAPGATPDAVRAFYAARMPVDGWTPTPLLPTLADAHAPCAASSACWLKTGAAITGADGDEGVATAEDVTLANIRAAPNGTEYTVEIVSYYTKS